MPDDVCYLYGGDRAWDPTEWATSDDRVRGGASQSYLSVTSHRRACFHGHLDTKTLGGAGFASQHTAGTLALDLRDYEGIVVSIAGPDAADGKRYALTVKDELPPLGHDGREQASVSWEAQFTAHKPGDVKLAWDDFKPTYRGRPKHDCKPLNRGDIQRIGLMMRSYFGKQSGDFSLNLHGILAWRHATDGYESDDEESECAKPVSRAPLRRPWWKKLMCCML
ncbi:hypothetical protein CDD82_588 [Ophiocordyceps australis]|uniref:NADH:ubiquinone oxidoreductase intermediate-associated protein 30 domain-containing protein n=1 Tax=Ophiocordyceps australis TaxID=1399860 RepID=A0A2C5ZKE0_9HYPO|nr:hypothetical protein CDD82_588 [Ophiocordyceps australis]